MAHAPSLRGHPPSRDDFEVAIICALPLEHQAVEATFDENYESDRAIYSVVDGDRNVYTTGRIGNNNVVLVQMPSMGSHSSAAVAAGLNVSFRNIRLCLIVGVCGGAVRTQEGDEIYLGDVVISTNIIHIGFGRRYPHGFIKKEGPEDTLGRANPQIRAFVSQFKNKTMVQRLQQRMMGYLDEMLANNVDGCQYPGEENDRLFSPSYRHKHRNEDTSCRICSLCLDHDDEVCDAALVATCLELGCEESQQTPRGTGLSDVTGIRIPSVHTGRIASGNEVIKSGLFREQVVADEKVIAFEMEGAGASDYLPVVVVKGVCDYADSHKNKVFQPWAAVTAAVCSKGMLSMWRCTEGSFDRAGSLDKKRSHPESYWSNLGGNDGRRKVQKLDKHEGELSLRSKQEDECKQSLCFPEMNARSVDIDLAHPHTCDWLFSTPIFRQWIHEEDVQSHNGVLWIKGKPGSGKSTLMKHTLLRCERTYNKDVIFAKYFFHARGTTLEKSTIGLLRTLLYQLISACPSLASLCLPAYLEITDRYRGSSKEASWSPKELKRLIAEALAFNLGRRVILFVDALDECDDKDVRNMVSFLEDLSLQRANGSPGLNICLSSRHYPTISMRKCLELTVEKITGHSNDIELYVHDKLRVSDSRIVEQLLQKASGVFMWIILVIQILNREFDRGRIGAMRRALNEIPDDLDTLFSTIFEKSDSDRAQTVLLFQWMMFGRLPQGREYLYSAVLMGIPGVTVEEISLDGPESPSAQDMDRFIISISKGLVEVRINDGIVPYYQFIHETVRDFLARNQRFSQLDPTLRPDMVAASHDRMMKCCLLYLRLTQDQDVITTAPARCSYYFKQSRRRFPLLLTIAKSLLWLWEESITDQTPKKELMATAQEVQSLMVMSFLTVINARYGCNSRNSRGTPDGSLLHWLISDGREKLLKRLHWITWANSKDPQKHTEGHESDFATLIDVNAPGGLYGNALQTAIIRRHMNIARYLIEAGADINDPGGYHGNALQAYIITSSFTLLEISNSEKDSVIRQQSSYLEYLITMGADVNAEGGPGRFKLGTALQAAVWAESIEAVTILLQAGAKVNTLAGKYGTALQTCARRGNNKVATLLLQAGAEVDIVAGKYGTALHAAVSRSNRDIIETLIKAGANVNALGRNYGTALQAAAVKCDMEVLEMLIKAGADVNAQGGKYGTALQAAAFKNSIEIVKVLITAGADVNVRGGKFGSALKAATGTESFSLLRDLVATEMTSGQEVSDRSEPNDISRHSNGSNGSMYDSDDLDDISDWSGFLL